MKLSFSVALTKSVVESLAELTDGDESDYEQNIDQGSPMEKAALTPFIPPTLLSKCFTNFLTNGKPWLADCKYCTVKKCKKDVSGNQSNFRKHLPRAHPAEWKKVEELEREKGQSSKGKILTNSVLESFGFSEAQPQQQPVARKQTVSSKYYD